MADKKHRLHINTALEKLVFLFGKWGLDNKDYVLVDEFAYVLQGYDVKATEVKSGHLDVYVNPLKLPWEDKKERSIIPPIKGGYMDEWADFMKETGYNLDMLRAKPEILQIPTTEHSLSNEKKFRLMLVFEMTKAFVQQTIMHYSLNDVGEDKIREWVDKLGIIKEAAEKNKDKRLSEFCELKLAESKKKWKDIL